jgi:ABC-2 type transport system ATP-binding protein
LSAAIEIRKVSKRFRLYQEKYTSLKERVIHMGRIPFHEFWALKEIELDIEEGTTVGLLGHNGSGKSTLLKCIAGILQPTSGEILTAGRVAPMLELGSGFHPDLTGRENVFLNASILGISRRDTARMFDEIVAFAEIEPFIDNQVKYYSSGMYMRLGFAVAVSVDPDILIVDEVLAVGDEMFQRKCLDRIRQFQREGRTIVFVTHSADMARQVCDYVAVLDQGELVTVGPPGESIRTFREHLLSRKSQLSIEAGGFDFGDEATASTTPAEDGAQAGEDAPQVPLPGEERRNLQVRITSVKIEHPGVDHPYLVPHERLTVRIGYEAPVAVEDMIVAVAAYDQRGEMVFGQNNDLLGIEFPPIVGSGEIRFDFDGVPLLDGTYPVTIGFYSRDGAIVYDWHEQRYSFEVMNPGRGSGLVDVPTKVTVVPNSSAQPGSGSANQSPSSATASARTGAA